MKLKKRIIGILQDSGISLLFLTLATVLGLLFQYGKMHETNIVVMYIFSVLLIARFTKGYAYGVLSTIASLLLFNWFFTAPYYTLKVDDPTYSITFLIMMITAIIMSAVTTKVKQAAVIAKENEMQSNALYKMTNLLTDAQNAEDIASIAVKTVSTVFSCNAAILCYDTAGHPENTFIQQKGEEQIRRTLHNPKEMQNRMKQLITVYDADAEFYNYPIYGGHSILAVMRIPLETAKDMTDVQLRLLHSIIESISLAMERQMSLKAQAKTREEATQERYRGNLLRAISHDIRTPLSGIMGSGEMLMGMTEKDDPRYQIAEGIYKDADWLHALVENILNLTKLQDGRLILHKEPEAIEEVIGAAVSVMEKRAPTREIAVSIPDELVMVPMDIKLVSQLLVNLLDNASKHTPENQEIGITATVDANDVIFTVWDTGEGISKEDLPHIFQMFYTKGGKSADSARGVGLGLAICESIAEAHGGTIKAANREEGGAAFTFTLPLAKGENDET